MASVRYEPIETIVIHNLVINSFTNFRRIHCTGSNEPDARALWCDGVLFSLDYPPPSEASAERLYNGEQHIFTASYCFVDFQPVITHPEFNTPLVVIDVTTDPFFSSVARWIKNNHKK